MTDWIAGFLMILGASLVLLAAIGVLRMPDLFTRMQAATKAATLGLGCLLAGAAVLSSPGKNFFRKDSISDTPPDGGYC